LQRGLAIDPRHVNAWHALGGNDVGVGGGVVSGVRYTQAECFQRALQLDPRHVASWCALGVYARGGVVSGETYSKVDCLLRALAIDPSHADSWWNLGSEGGGVVAGVRHSEMQCYAIVTDGPRRANMAAAAAVTS
jgi:hypothetical protein